MRDTIREIQGLTCPSVTALGKIPSDLSSPNNFTNSWRRSLSARPHTTMRLQLITKQMIRLYIFHIEITLRKNMKLTIYILPHRALFCNDFLKFLALQMLEEYNFAVVLTNEAFEILVMVYTSTMHSKHATPNMQIHKTLRTSHKNGRHLGKVQTTYHHFR